MQRIRRWKDSHDSVARVGVTTGQLERLEDKLLFILIYEKTYPLQSMLGLQFGLSQGRVGQRVLNTTIKSGTGLGAVFAPTWKMVMASKRDEITWDEYRSQCIALMRQRYQVNPAAFLEALSSAELIVCCYCKDTHATTKRCHRYILVEILEKVAAHHGIVFEAIGEVRSSR
jgi:Helix-turn-helix of DDE superfamily endonuclease